MRKEKFLNNPYYIKLYRERVWEYNALPILLALKDEPDSSASLVITQEELDELRLCFHRQENLLTFVRDVYNNFLKGRTKPNQNQKPKP